MLSMSHGMGFRQICRCTICGESVEDHATDCPQGQLENLQNEHWVMQCTECKVVAVDINIHDFFECRRCHTQFCSGSHMDHGQRKVTLEHPQTCELIQVVVLEAKGDGRFKFDEQMMRARKAIDLARKRTEKAS